MLLCALRLLFTREAKISIFKSPNTEKSLKPCLPFRCPECDGGRLARQPAGAAGRSLGLCRGRTVDGVASSGSDDDPHGHGRPLLHKLSDGHAFHGTPLLHDPRRGRHTGKPFRKMLVQRDSMIFSWKNSRHSPKGQCSTIGVIIKFGKN